MLIGGLQKFSLIDYPEKISAVIFTIGCNFRCQYCHNPELIIPEQFRNPLALDEIYEFLESRRGKLDAVSITGGEPTLQPDLIEVIEMIKSLGFLIKLDTNGTRPQVLRRIIECRLVDYIAMDIKAPLAEYPKITGCNISTTSIKQSIDLIINSDIDHEFRTTIAKSLTGKSQLRIIADEITGAKNYYLQKFIPSKLYNNALIDEATYSDEELNELSQELVGIVERCGVR